MQNLLQILKTQSQIIQNKVWNLKFNGNINYKPKTIFKIVGIDTESGVGRPQWSKFITMHPFR